MRVRARGSAQIGDHVRRRPPPGGDREQPQEGRPGGRLRERDPCLGRDRDTEPREDAGEERRLPVRRAQGDGDVVGIDPLGQELRDGAADELGLAAVPGALEQAKRGEIGLGGRRVGLEQMPFDVLERVRARPARQRRLDVRAELVHQRPPQLRAGGRSRASLLEGDGDGDLGGGGEAPTSSTCWREERSSSRAGTRGGSARAGVGPERGDGGIGERALVGEPRGVPEAFVG